MEEFALQHETGFLILFSVATAVSIAARWLQIPYTVALVLVGLGLGSTHAVEVPHLTKELLFSVILPGLVFEAAFHLDASKFWSNRLAIHSLAIPGLVMAIALTSGILQPVASALHFVDGFEWIHAAVFASIIVATDPIAVVGLFKSLGAPKRLAVLVEGESLLNDGTGVVLFLMIVGIATGTPFVASAALVEFLKVAGLGALVGVLIGYAASRLVEQIDDPMVELTLTVIAAYGSFVAAERLHLSGVMATVFAGMMCGNYGARIGMSPTTRVAVETFWEYLAFALNSIVFLLIGSEVRLEGLLAAWKPILVAYLAVMIGRAAVVYGVAGILAPTRERIPWAWSTVIWWAGLRGALSMVLALGLPAGFPHRELLVNMTFGVVLLSILVQGLSMSWLLRKLGVAGGVSLDRRAYERERGGLRAAIAAVDELAAVERERTAGAALRERLRLEYRARIEAAEKRIDDLHLAEATLRDEDEKSCRRRLLVAERDAVIQAAHKGMVGADVLHELLSDIDARVADLEAGAPRVEPSSSPPAPAP